MSVQFNVTIFPRERRIVKWEVLRLWEDFRLGYSLATYETRMTEPIPQHIPIPEKYNQERAFVVIENLPEGAEIFQFTTYRHTVYLRDLPKLIDALIRGKTDMNEENIEPVALPV